MWWIIADDCDHLRTPVKKRLFTARYFGDIASIDIAAATPRTSKRYLSIAKETIRKQARKIKTLQQKNRRLLEKVKTLQAMVNHLSSCNILTEEAVDNIIKIEEGSC